VPGGRLTDQILGIIVDVKVGDEIVYTDSDCSTLLKKVLEKREE